MARIVESLYCAPETNAILYVNCTGTKIFKKRERNLKIEKKQSQDLKNRRDDSRGEMPTMVWKLESAGTSSQQG